MSLAGQHAIAETLESFVRDTYPEKLGELAANYPGEQTSLAIEYSDLYRFDQDLAYDWLEQPEHVQDLANVAIQNIAAGGIELSEASVRLTDTEEFTDRIGIGDLTSDRIGEYVAVRGQLNRVSGLKPRLEEAVFVCQRCNHPNEIPQPRTRTQEPHECKSCERQGPFKLDEGNSTWVDLRKCKLEEPPEDQVDTRGESVPVYTEGDLVHEGGDNGLADHAGERVTFLGRLAIDDDSITGRNGSPEGEKYVEARAVVFDESDPDEVDVDAYEDEIEALKARAGDDLIDAYRDSIAPTILADSDGDLEVVMESLVAYLFNAYRIDPEGQKGQYRGDIHLAIIGDPGLGKSSILAEVAKLAPTSEFRSGTGVSKVGLTAAADREEFLGESEWTLKPGILPRANGGHAIIDEIDEVVDEKTKAIHDALEGEQKVKVDKAGIQADLPTRTAVCISGNPADGRFGPGSITDQIEMDPALISRMDAIFALEDEADEERDAEIADHILGSYDELSQYELAEQNPEVDPPEDAERVEPEIPQTVFRAAIQHARDAVFPTLTAEARATLKDFYTEVRQLNEGNGDGDNPVPATARKLEAGIRLATAFARAEFSDDVLPRHAERAVRISKKVVGLNYDPETGKFDAARTEKGTPKSQKQRRHRLRETIQERHPDESDRGVPVESLVEELVEQWDAAESTLRHDLKKMKHEDGELYEPRTGELRVA